MFYADMKATSKQLIKEYGAEITLERTTKQNYDPVEGTSDNTITTYQGYAVLSSQERARRDGRLIAEGDKLATMVIDEPPKIADVLIISGQRWAISSIETVSPGGIDLMYKCQVGKA